MSDSRPRRMRRVSILTVAALVLTTGVSTAVLASHVFPGDVTDDNQFHSSIAWMADNDVTLGCNPPANDQYCPKDNVSREQMAAFMRRLAQTFGSVADQVTGTGDTVAVDSVNLVEIASVAVTPKAEANVNLNAHVVLSVGDVTSGPFGIHLDNCSGEEIASGQWQINPDVAPLMTSTFSVTGMDVVTEDATYVLCVAKEEAGSPDAEATQRALTATWSPTS